MTTLPSEVKAALRKKVDHLLHVQFERGKHETAEFARLHWDNKQSWPTLNDALMQAIEETLQPEIERLVVVSHASAQRRLCEALKRAVFEHPEWPADEIVVLIYKETNDLIEAEENRNG